MGGGIEVREVGDGLCVFGAVVVMMVFAIRSFVVFCWVFIFLVGGFFLVVFFFRVRVIRRFFVFRESRIVFFVFVKVEG